MGIPAGESVQWGEGNNHLDGVRKTAYGAVNSVTTVDPAAALLVVVPPGSCALVRVWGLAVSTELLGLSSYATMTTWDRPASDPPTKINEVSSIAAETTAGAFMLDLADPDDLYATLLFTPIVDAVADGGWVRVSAHAEMLILPRPTRGS